MKAKIIIFTTNCLFGRTVEALMSNTPIFKLLTVIDLYSNTKLIQEARLEFEKKRIQYLLLLKDCKPTRDYRVKK
jgi:hypothetical protein